MWRRDFEEGEEVEEEGGGAVEESTREGEGQSEGGVIRGGEGRRGREEEGEGGGGGRRGREEGEGGGEGRRGRCNAPLIIDEL